MLLVVFAFCQCGMDMLIKTKLEELLHLRIGGILFAIFQLHDVGIRHILIDVTERRKEYVGIATVIIQLVDRTVELALTGHRQRKAMHKSLPLLLVSLRRVALQAVGDIIEIRLIIAMECQLALQLVLAV